MTIAYDEIAQIFEHDASVKLQREHIFKPTFQNYLPDLRGKKVLDLACGGGYTSRIFKYKGASKVVGIDFSSEMIDLAKKREAIDPLGITYYVENILDLKNIDDFDFAFAGFCLHYAANIDELKKMCCAVSKNLKSGSQFLAFNENPESPIHQGIHFGSGIKAAGKLDDGVMLTRTHYDENKQPMMSFSHYHYEPETYTTALTEADFSLIQWRPFVVDPDATEQGHKHDWSVITRNEFGIAVLSCVRE